MTPDADEFLEAAISGAFPPVLFAPVTWVYLMHVNLIHGVECHVYADVRSAAEFPWLLIDSSASQV